MVAKEGDRYKVGRAKEKKVEVGVRKGGKRRELGFRWVTIRKVAYTGGKIFHHVDLDARKSCSLYRGKRAVVSRLPNFVIRSKGWS